jgi:hypothetical protein
VNQVSAYLEVAALCLLLVGLAAPPTRNFMMLLVYGQSMHVRRDGARASSVCCTHPSLRQAIRSRFAFFFIECVVVVVVVVVVVFFFIKKSSINPTPTPPPPFPPRCG